MGKRYRVLVADDDAIILSTLKLMLKVHQFEVITATQPEEVLTQVRQGTPDIALVDLNYQRDTTSGQEGLSLIESIRQIDADLPVVVMSGWGSIDIAVDAMKNGAADFIQKPWENERLVHVLNTQLQLVEGIKKQRSLLQQNTLLQEQLHPCLQKNIVACSRAMQELLNLLDQVIPSDASILLTGENGTGKSMLASYIHQRSMRREMSYVSVNMGCIPDSLFESEMFGHVKGAFTDAKQQRIGRFELADGGTLFLDEIGNTPLNQQVKLLRMLEERQFEKVGASKTQFADVRIIAATNADFDTMIANGSFRRDLYYRLNTFEFRVPALRERPEDIGPLAQGMMAAFAEKYRKPVLVLTSEALELLQQYPWPGNIRELNHILERAVLLSRAGTLDVPLLKMVLSMDFTPNNADNRLPCEPTCADNLPGISAAVDLNDEGPWQTLDDIEQMALQQRLREFDGNVIEAAESLGLSRSAFYRRLKKNS
ncbi:sigma-54 dependent transcriptional regulator [Pectobacteriaceae bacterium C52]|nr:sigma-54 dependent transcriptional regulator [Pectobacteriaceae bacterium C52]